VAHTTPHPTPIFHVTSIDNLGGILARGGLSSWSKLYNQGFTYTNIAHQSIQARRAVTPVGIPHYGNLHDYVPFYFAPRSPMLYTISRGNVEGYPGGQEDIIHMVSSAQAMQEAEKKFVFTDGHAIMAFTGFFSELSDLDNVDWAIMKETFWADTDDDPDRKRRRQAEFLVYDYVQWSLIQQIGVMNELIAEKVKGIIKKSAHQPIIRVCRPWYY